MTDLDDVIREGLGQLAATRTPTDGLAAQGIRARVARRSRTRHVLGAAVPLVATGAFATIALWPSDDGADTVVVTDPEPTVTTTTVRDDIDTDATSWDVPGIETLDPGPLSARMTPAVLWTDEGILVWGGRTESGNFPFEETTSFADGALYDPGADTWTSIAEAPFPSSLGAAAEAVLVADGRVVAFGDDTAGVWDPSSDTWRELGPIPGPLSDPIWTGEWIVATVRDGYYASTARWIRVDPTTGETTDLPAPPIALERAEVVWTGQEVIAVGKPEGIPFPTAAEGVAYDPTSERWRQLPRAPIEVQAPTITWDGDEVLLVDHSMASAIYDPATNEWRAIAAMPAIFFEGGVTSTSAGGYSLIANRMVVRLPSGAWVPVAEDPTLPLFADGMAAGPDGRVYRFGPIYEEGVELGTLESGFQRIDLPTVAEGRSLSLGHRFDLPEDVELISAVGDATLGNGISSRLLVAGEDCEVEFDAGTTALSRAGTVMVDPVDGSEEWTAFTNSERTSFALGGLDLTCESPETTLYLARHVRWTHPPEG